MSIYASTILEASTEAKQMLRAVDNCFARNLQDRYPDANWNVAYYNQKDHNKIWRYAPLLTGTIDVGEVDPQRLPCVDILEVADYCDATHLHLNKVIFDKWHRGIHYAVSIQGYQRMTDDQVMTLKAIGKIKTQTNTRTYTEEVLVCAI